MGYVQRMWGSINLVLIDTAHTKPCAARLESRKNIPSVSMRVCWILMKGVICRQTIIVAMRFVSELALALTYLSTGAVAQNRTADLLITNSKMYCFTLF